MFKILEKEFKSGKMAENELGFVFCDINDLKTVNDNFNFFLSYSAFMLMSLIMTMRMGIHKNAANAVKMIK